MPQLIIPDHTLLRVIGRGAYGEVWLAKNLMGSLRAVKVIWRGPFENNKPFEREFAGIQRYEPVSAASGGLVHLFHVGRNDSEGYFYYVMELADSTSGTESIEEYQPRTLRSDLLTRGALTASECLRLASEVCSGLAHLHRHGLVHRDVKPGNIIYVKGRAKLADIGLVSTGGEGKTFVGTEGYIPPEGPGTSAADLYALGMVLYQASTGFSPDRCPDVPPEWVMQGNKAALEFFEIVLKACEGQRELRYRSAAELQADLALLENGESVRQMRVFKRHYLRLRGIAVAAAALAAAALIIGTSAAYRARLAAESRKNERALREQAQSALARTEAAEREARHELYKALLEQARATVRSGDLGQRNQALEAIRQAAAITNTAELRGAAMVALSLPDLRKISEMPQPPGATLAYLAPDFQRIAFFFGRKDGELRSRDSKILATLKAGARGVVSDAEWSQDGTHLWVRRNLDAVPETTSLEIWNCVSGAQVVLCPQVASGACGFHPLQPLALVGLDKGAVALFDLRTGKEVRRFELGRPPSLLCVAPDGLSFATSMDWPKYEVSIYSTVDGKKLLSQPLSGFAASIAWSPGGQWLATADRDGFVHLMDAHTGKLLQLGRHKLQASLVQFSPDGDYLMSGGWDREFNCWDMRRLERSFAIPLDAFRMQFSENQSNSVAIVTDTTIQFHEFQRPTVVRELTVEIGPRLNRAAFSENGQWIAATGNSGLAVWALDGGSHGCVQQKGADARLFFSKDSRRLYAYDTESAFCWEVSPSTQSEDRPRMETRRLPDAESPDASIPSGAAYLWNRESAGPSGSSAPRVPSRVEISPNGKWLAGFEPYSPILHLYPLPSLQGATNLTLTAHVARFHFSPSCRELAVDTSQGIEFFKVDSWEHLRSVPNAIALQYMPDEKSFWLTHNFREAALHDAENLQTLLPLPVGSHPLAVSADGRWLAVRVDGRRLLVWNLESLRSQFQGLGLGW